MNPHAAHSSSPQAMITSIWQNRRLIKQMAWREVVGRYKGSVFGLAWSFFNPLLMLSVYTFVFTVIFQARWNVAAADSKSDFALILFVGLIIHALFAEVLNRAPSIILGNANYVKKVVFSLEILTVISLGAALFHSSISIIVLMIAFIVLDGNLSWTIVLAPLTLLPLLPMILGFGWFLASLGVYLRDMGQMIGLITTVLLFLAPVFYPANALPEPYLTILQFNPLTIPIEQTRAVILFGTMPDWNALLLYTIVSLVICWMGFWWFQKTRKGFADVV